MGRESVILFEINGGTIPPKALNIVIDDSGEKSQIAPVSGYKSGVERVKRTL